MEKRKQRERRGNAGGRAGGGGEADRRGESVAILAQAILAQGFDQSLCRVKIKTFRRGRVFFFAAGFSHTQSPDQGRVGGLNLRHIRFCSGLCCATALIPRCTPGEAKTCPVPHSVRGLQA